MPVGKGIDRTNLSGLNRSKISEHDAGNVMGTSSRIATLIKTARQGSGALEFSPPTTNKGAEFGPGKIMSTLVLSLAEPPGRNLKEGSTGCPQMRRQGRTAALKEDTQGPPQTRVGVVGVDKVSGARGEGNERLPGKQRSAGMV